MRTRENDVLIAIHFNSLQNRKRTGINITIMAWEVVVVMVITKANVNKSDDNCDNQNIEKN